MARWRTRLLTESPKIKQTANATFIFVVPRTSQDNKQMIAARFHTNPNIHS